MIRKIAVSLCLFIAACTPIVAIPPAPTLTGDDGELNAAIAQAHDSLPIFIQTIATPHADRTFVALKVRFFPSEALPQDIWVDNIVYMDGVFHGNMGDDIPSLKLEFDEKVAVNEKDIIDWMIVQDGKLIGGYTIRLTVQRMTPEERERFFQSIDYVIED